MSVAVHRHVPGPERLLSEPCNRRHAPGCRRDPASVRRLTSGPGQALERMDDAIRTELPALDPPAAERYLLLADISGYTGFMAGVEQAHGIDFSAGIPAAYSVLGALLDTVIVG